jgi:hypothetical protein
MDLPHSRATQEGKELRYRVRLVAFDVTYLLRTNVVRIIPAAKAAPSPMMIPYPTPCPSGGVALMIAQRMSDCRQG